MRFFSTPVQFSIMILLVPCSYFIFLPVPCSCYFFSTPVPFSIMILLVPCSYFISYLFLVPILYSYLLRVPLISLVHLFRFLLWSLLVPYSYFIFLSVPCSYYIFLPVPWSCYIPTCSMFLLYSYLFHVPIIFIPVPCSYYNPTCSMFLL